MEFPVFEFIFFVSCSFPWYPWEGSGSYLFATPDLHIDTCV